MSLTALLFLLGAEVLFLYWGQRRVVALLLQRSYPLACFFALPGTVLHELSHLALCLVLGVPVGRVELFRPRQMENGSLQLGMVQSAQTDPLRQAAISSAPLFLVPLFLAGVLTLLLGTSLWSAPWEAFSGAAIWQQVLAVYILLSSAGAAFPSSGDYIPPSGAVSIVLLFVLLLFAISPDLQAILQIATLGLAPAALSSALLLFLLGAHR